MSVAVCISSTLFLLLDFTEAFHCMHLPYLFIHFLVMETKLHQTLWYHKQWHDEYLFICTCLYIYF